MGRKKKTKKKREDESVTALLNSKSDIDKADPPTYIPLNPLGNVSTTTSYTAPTETYVQPGSNQEIEVLERDKKLSECMLWKMQEDFYCNAGIAAWNQVPFYPTCNAFIGRTYAEMILAFLLDYHDKLDLSQPVYIVEMAAGSGGLSFYVTKELTKRIQHYARLADVRFVYVMTDFTENNVQAWEANPKFFSFVEDGVMDFAVFRPEDQDTIFLRQRQIMLEHGTVANPIIAVANYFFDTIRHDLFRIENGNLMEGRVNFFRQVDDTNRFLPPTLLELHKTEHFVKTNPNYYPDSELNKILRQYREMFKNASVLFPISSFKCLHNLLHITNNKLVLISSDKGFTHADYMNDHWDQNYALHGSFSFMVNYHAIGQYFMNQGGLYFSTTERDLCLATVMGILVEDARNESFDNCRYYFLERVDRENPINNLYFSQDLLHMVHYTHPGSAFRGCMSLLKLCNYDPIVFYFIGEYLYNGLEQIDMSQRLTLIHAMKEVYKNFFLIRRDFNTLYWLGKIYYGLDCFHECLQAFHRSIELFGVDSHSTYYVAACYEVLGDTFTALEFYKQTLDLEPDCPLTQAGFARMYEKLSEQLAELQEQGSPT